MKFLLILSIFICSCSTVDTTQIKVGSKVKAPAGFTELCKAKPQSPEC